jgi:hypothetical protein
MGRMVDEIGDYLEAQGVMGGASPWTSARCGRLVPEQLLPEGDDG